MALGEKLKKIPKIEKMDYDHFIHFKYFSQLCYIYGLSQTNCESQTDFSFSSLFIFKPCPVTSKYMAENSEKANVTSVMISP